MVELKDRMRKLRIDQKLTQQGIADVLGVRRNTWGQYEIGRNVPMDAIIESVCREFSVNKQWLLTGEGEMYIKKDEVLSKYVSDITDSEDEFIKNFIMTYMELDDVSKQALRKMAQNMAEKYKGEE